MIHRFAKGLALLLVCLSLLSCATKNVDINVEKIDIRDILDSIKSAHDDITTLKGFARVKALNRSDSVNFNQATVLQSPNMFRLEALAIFGQTVAVVISDGEKVYFRTPKEKLTFEEAESFNLSYLYPEVPSDLTTPELINVMLGKVPFGLWNEDLTLDIDDGSEKRLLVVYKNLNSTKTVLKIDPLYKRVENAVVELSSGDTLTIYYGEYIEVGGYFFPKKIKLLYSSNELSIRYDDNVSLNSDIENSLFFP